MIGIIADDVTGGTDAASACRDAGLTTALSFGVPEGSRACGDVGAHVIALKTRSAPAAEAIAQTLDAARRLRADGADLYYFKYCSTFDSTPAGNIGPVLDALSDFTGAPLVITTPAAPAHSRTVYQGYLFVGDLLLSESHMKDHPLTPMRDSSVPRLLAAQSQQSVGRLPLQVIRQGPSRVTGLLDEAVAASTQYIIADAITDEDLQTVAQAASSHSLSAGSAGLIGAIARGRAATPTSTPAIALPSRAAVVAGSCSKATLAQIAAFKEADLPWFELDVLGTPDAETLAETALAWFDQLHTDRPALIYSSRPAAQLAAIQRKLGAERSARILEQATALIAVGLVARGVGRIISAGGETSGAVVDGLELRTGWIGKDAAPGVPWIHADGRDLAVLLKSGNFGDRDLLVRAATQEIT